MKVEDIKNGVSSSPFTKSASDVDGKGQKNYKRMGIGLSNQKKAVMKGYASPTISASSKAIGQRKGILSERSEKSGSINNKTQMETGSGQDPSSCNGAHSSPQSGSLSHEDSGLNRNDGFSSKQYDPLTNYLSPRPRFLRYRPNRSREIFLRRQNEVGEEIHGGTALNDEQKVLFSPGSSSSEEISENEQEQEQEQEEEKEEESKEDGEEIEEDDEEFEEDKGWTLKEVFKVLSLLMAAFLYATHISSSNTDSMSSHSFRSNEVLSNGTCSALRWESDFLDPTYGRRKGWKEQDVKMIVDKFENSSLNVNNFIQAEEVDGGFNDQSAEVAELKDTEREVGGFEGEGKDGEDDLTAGEGQEFEDHFHCQEPTETKIFENEIETNDDQNPFSSEIAAANKELAITKTDSSEKMAGGDSNFFSLLRMLREKTYSENKIIQNMNTQLFFQILISFSAFLIVAIVSVVFYRSKRKIAAEEQQLQRVEALELENENTLAKISPLTLKACSESMIVEENASIISREGRPLASIWLEEEKGISNERFYNSRAPTVELLGEFVVGGETENTLNNRMIESRDSNNSVSRPALSELSNSPSYGSFTAEKIVKNEAGGGGDLKVISTPVRRSSRIKNRAAMSP